MSRRVGIALLTGLTATSVAAADLLPLERGIYVDIHAPCKGASNADTVSYWGSRNGINVSKAACTIKALKRRGQNYALRRACRDVYGGSWHDRLKITVLTRTSFIIRTEWNWTGLPPQETTVRYCGPKVQF
jgi:hypothetical protein